jgi:putative transposase
VKKFQPQPGFVVQAYRFALDPNATQEHALRSHCGAARAAYNWAVGWVSASWWQRRAEETYGIGEAGLTKWRPWSLPALRKAFNEAKHTDPRFAAWWQENSKEAYSTGLANASAAFDNYAKSKNGKRRGKRMGAPRFKSKRKARLACRFTTGVIRVDAGGRHVTLPRLGTIRTHEPTVKLLTRVRAGTARILSATVRHERGRWFVSFQAEVKRDLEPVARPEVAVGIDLGVKMLAVMADSTGEIRTIANPGHHDRARKQLTPRLPDRVPPPGPRPQDRAEALEAVGEGQRRPQQGASPGGQPPRGRPAQAHHKRGGRVRHGRRGRPQRRRDAPQPAPGPPDRRRRVR